MKKSGIITLILSLGLFFGAQAQKSIMLNAAKSIQQCDNVNEKGFTASFSFNSIETNEINTEEGVFSEIAIRNTFNHGSYGEPSLPSVHHLIAVPFGAKDINISVKSYSTSVYNLSDYGIRAIAPQQPSVRKDQKEVPFHYNAEAYAKKGFMESPIAEVEIQGTMRGIQVGALIINPVQYDAANNTIKVFNDIEVEVCYGEYDKTAAYDEFARTASIYFAPIYRQMFNWRDDFFDQHPDLWKAPVKMLVIANRMFEDAIQEWVNWKIKKGFYMDVNYTDQVGTSASTIRSFIQNKYDATAPTFVVIIGDNGLVPASATGSATHCVTDLYYETVDNDYYPDMLHSRMPVENVEQLNNLLEKSLQYEQYTMPDPSYLDNALLIAGWDEAWNPKAGVPTIQYAVNYYYNEEHGFANVYDYYNQSDYAGCYGNMNTGVGFVNYTAHGSNTSWEAPEYTVNDVNNLTNTNKYFLVMGNCCKAADWGISGACLGEAFVRAPKKGAFAYVGSCPSTYWYEDYYFGVGATNVFYRMPTKDETLTGVYDGIWMENSYNTIQSMVFLGNLSVTNVHLHGGYTVSSDSSPLYYWQCYHTLGDGSIMPYHVRPNDNHVYHISFVPAGATTYDVTADPGSYVALTRNGVIFGTGLVDETGKITLETETITSGGNMTLCVTHPQRVPHLEELPVGSLEEACVIVEDYTPAEAHIGTTTNMSVVLKNIGESSTSGTTTATLTCNDPSVTIVNGTVTFDALESGATTQLDGFQYIISNDVADGSKIFFDIAASCGSTTWNDGFSVIATKAVIEFNGATCPGEFTPGDEVTVTASFKNAGHYMATGAVVSVSSSSEYVSFEEEEVTLGTIEPDGTATAVFHLSIADECPESETIYILFHLSADEGISADGAGSISNYCLVIFELSDKWADGWDNSRLHVVYSDGTPADDMYVPNGGGAFATYERSLRHGSHVTMTWQSGGNWDSECSYVVRYADGTVIISNGPQGGQFDVNCDSSIDFEPVQNLQASITDNTVTLSWNPHSGAVKYRVARNGIVLDETVNTFFTDEIEYGIPYNYSVTAIYVNGESLPANIIVELGVGIEEENEDDFNIYPTPADDVINIDLGDTDARYFIYDNIGRLIINGTSKGLTKIDVSSLKEGLYIVKICGREVVKTAKIIVK